MKVSTRNLTLGFGLSPSGLVIHESYPHIIGASPDSIVTCNCCVKGVIEGKCPFTCRDKTFLEATANITLFHARKKTVILS